MNQKGSSRLAAAVISRALEDLNKTKEKLKENPQNSITLADLEELQIFFESTWFETLCALCDMNPEFIRKRLKEEYSD